MLLRFVLWSLVDSDTTIADLRTYLREESVDQFSEVPGLLFKAWVSDEATERWGADVRLGLASRRRSRNCRRVHAS